MDPVRFVRSILLGLLFLSIYLFIILFLSGVGKSAVKFYYLNLFFFFSRNGVTGKTGTAMLVSLFFLYFFLFVNSGFIVKLLLLFFNLYFFGKHFNFCGLIFLYLIGLFVCFYSYHLWLSSYKKFVFSNSVSPWNLF